MSLVGHIVVSIIGIFLVGGGYLFLYYNQQEKRTVYKAYCYNITDAKKLPKRDKFGKVISNIDLAELRPFCTDTLISYKKDEGVTIFKLRRQNISTGEVRAEHIEHWGKEKHVKVLIQNGSATLLSPGYNKDTAKIIFDPMPREDIELITQRIINHKERKEVKDKNILAHISHWVSIVIISFFLLASAWQMKDAMIETNQINKEIAEQHAETANIINSNANSILGQQREMTNELISQRQQLNEDILASRIPSIE